MLSPGFVTSDIAGRRTNPGATEEQSKGKAPMFGTSLPKSSACE